MSDSPSVPFDFGRALELARALSSIADRWQDAFDDRLRTLDTAFAAWRGPARDATVDAVAVESDVSAAAVASLRLEARWWALAWADALDELNRQRWRLSLQAAADGGEPVELSIPAPPPVEVPSPPHFEPTAVVPAPEVLW